MCPGRQRSLGLLRRRVLPVVSQLAVPESRLVFDYGSIAPTMPIETSLAKYSRTIEQLPFVSCPSGGKKRYPRRSRTCDPDRRRTIEPRHFRITLAANWRSRFLLRGREAGSGGPRGSGSCLPRSPHRRPPTCIVFRACFCLETGTTPLLAARLLVPLRRRHVAALKFPSMSAAPDLKQTLPSLFSFETHLHGACEILNCVRVGAQD